MNTLSTKSDEQLIALYVGGLNEAFDEILERHKDRIFMYILSIVKDEDLANDLFQETFVKTIMNIKEGRYTENGKFAAWLTRVAHNIIIDHYRQQRTAKIQSTDNADLNILNRKELCEDTVEDEMISLQIRADIRRLIRALPHAQREVLLMRYYKNLSFKEISELTKVSINTALGRMRYALINMRRIADENHIALTM